MHNDDETYERIATASMYGCYIASSLMPVVMIAAGAFGLAYLWESAPRDGDPLISWGSLALIVGGLLLGLVRMRDGFRYT